MPGREHSRSSNTQHMWSCQPSSDQSIPQYEVTALEPHVNTKAKSALPDWLPNELYSGNVYQWVLQKLQLFDAGKARNARPLIQESSDWPEPNFNCD
jgi:hypothetical protein